MEEEEDTVRGGGHSVRKRKRRAQCVEEILKFAQYSQLT